MPRPLRYPLLAVLWLLAAVPSASGAGALEDAGSPPADLPAPIAAVLASAGVRVSLDGDPVWEVWPVRELPRAGGDPAFGQELSAIPSGELLGAVRILGEWSDYKGTRVGPGVYTLRYLLSPVDGAHMGTSLYRDFALLVPASSDGGPGETYGFDNLVELSRLATGTHHPAVVALFPDWSVAGGEGDAPALAANEIDQPTLLLEAGGVRFGLVVAGRGES